MLHCEILQNVDLLLQQIYILIVIVIVYFFIYLFNKADQFPLNFTKEITPILKPWPIIYSSIHVVGPKNSYSYKLANYFHNCLYSFKCLGYVHGQSKWAVSFHSTLVRNDVDFETVAKNLCFVSQGRRTVVFTNLSIVFIIVCNFGL